MEHFKIVKEHIEREFNQAPPVVDFIGILKRLNEREFVSPKQFFEIGGQFYDHAVQFIGNLARAVVLMEIKSDGLEAVNKNMNEIALQKGKEELIAFAEELVTAIHNETTTGAKVQSLGKLPGGQPTKENIRAYIEMLERHEQEINKLLTGDKNGNFNQRQNY